MTKHIKYYSIIVISIISLILLTVNVFSQSERKLVRDGNKKYESGKYSEAEINYRRSLEKNKSSFSGTYNLGDALYKQKKFDEAASQFNNSSTLTKDKKSQANNFHNLGNALLQAQKYEQSIDAFKNALKLNPDDNDTRYNLAYAQSMLKQQQQQQQQNKDNKDNKDNKQDQQQQKNKEDQKKEQQQKEQQQEQQKQDQKEEQAKQQEQKISKEDAERILQALKNNENDLQKRKAKKEGVKVKIEKQW